MENALSFVWKFYPNKKCATLIVENDRDNSFISDRIGICFAPRSGLKVPYHKDKATDLQKSIGEKLLKNDLNLDSIVFAEENNIGRVIELSSYYPFSMEVILKIQHSINSVLSEKTDLKAIFILPEEIIV